jgi:hypothetical protein
MRIATKMCVLALTATAATTANAIDLSATADTYTQSSTPTSNFGSSGIVAVANGRTTLVRFDPTAVAQSSGSTATLKVKVLAAKNSTNGVAVRVVTANWNEGTVNANNAPALGATLASRTITSGELGTTISLDVSGALAGWRSNPATNYGLAIVAASPVPNLQFGSREGGVPSVLSISGSTTPGNNSVTVAPSGGNYTSPVTAANNALQGDHWCASPQLPGSPCVMTIAAGVYILPSTLNIPEPVKVVGAGRTATLLVAAKGLGTAVSSRGRGFSDLSIINHQDSGGASGLDFAFGMNDEPVAGTNQIARVTIDVVAPGAAVGISTREAGDSRLENVNVIVRGAQATGINQFIPPAAIVDSLIDVVGTDFAQGIEQQAEPGGPASLTRTTVTAFGTSTATAVFLSGTRGTFTDSLLVSQGKALQVFGASPVTITHSTLRGASWFVGGSSTLNATDSILDGAATYGSTQATCSRVYNRSYQLLANTCPAP